MRATAVAAASAGTVLAGLLAYAIYFDHKRQSDPQFRRSLKRDNRRLAREVREESVAEGAKQMEAIKRAVADAKAEEFPTDLEEKEGYFMSHIAQGEALCASSTDQIEAALCFYKALKVYPQPKDLISIYDKTVPKEILEILAEMVAMDPSLKLDGSFTGGDSGSEGHGVE